MEVEYTLDVDDIIAFQKFHMEHGPMHHRPPKPGWGGLLLLALLVGALVAFEYWAYGELSVWVVVLVVVSGVLAVLAIYLRFQQPRLLASNLRRIYAGSEGKGELRPRKVTLSANALTITMRYATETIKWPGIEAVAWDEDYLFVYTAPTSAIVIPRAAFPDDDKFHAFLQQARRYHEQNPSVEAAM